MIERAISSAEEEIAREEKNTWAAMRIQALMRGRIARRQVVEIREEQDMAESARPRKRGADSRDTLYKIVLGLEIDFSISGSVY